MQIRVLFKTAWAVDSEWSPSVHGALQGCPWSMLLLGVLMGVEHRVYLEDRLFWTTDEGLFQRAAQICRRFDAKCKAVWSRGKGNFFDQDEVRAQRIREQWAEEIGPHTDTLTYLGVQYVICQVEGWRTQEPRSKAKDRKDIELRRINIGTATKQRRGA